MNKVTKKLMAVLLAVVMVFSVTVTNPTTAATTTEGTVTFTVEKFTIGQGYLVEPIQVPVKDGDTAASVFETVMKSKGITYPSTEGAYGFYLSAIDNADTGVINIPNEISSMPSVTSTWDGSITYAPTNEKNDGNSLPNKGLGAGSYNSMSGWMFMVNNNDPGEGADSVKVKNGDVIRLQFSVYGYGADIGFDTESYTGIVSPKLANKDALTAEVAAVNASAKMLNDANVKAAYDNAMTALQTYNISQENTDASLKALQQAEGAYETESLTTSGNSVTTPAPTTTVAPTTKATVKAPGKAKISKITAKKKASKKLKLSLKKISKAEGYQVAVYNTKKNANKNKKAIIKKIVKKTKATINNKKLKNKDKLYVKVRAYVLDGKKKVYGKWSNAKSVKIKK